MFEIYNPSYFIKHKYGGGFHVKHSKYNFILCHDFVYSGDTITNYDVVKKRFDEKIRNFRESLDNQDNILIFINFSEYINDLRIDDMVQCIESKTNVPFFIFIFTNDKIPMNPNPSNVIIIRLTKKFIIWPTYDVTNKKILYKEIYDKFIENLNLCGVKHDFPINFVEPKDIYQHIIF